MVLIFGKVPSCLVVIFSEARFFVVEVLIVERDYLLFIWRSIVSLRI